MEKIILHKSFIKYYNKFINDKKSFDLIYFDKINIDFTESNNEKISLGENQTLLFTPIPLNISIENIIIQVDYIFKDHYNKVCIKLNEILTEFYNNRINNNYDEIFITILDISYSTKDKRVKCIYNKNIIPVAKF